ncbi:MAG: sugar ABC transporter substrate-binding protein [Deltaproteobacteria bacterium HGW-Deltaproteobacteria-12]|jgi:ABC-type sugar transport system substrate-binding protein|nr:MAG: sugar ABC transporter substrate-binding protein [Deltaproteobacteria bacterium HGW-Deltaproteobacteria-12]
MKSIRVVLALIVSFIISAAMLQSAMAVGIDDPARLDYYKALKGKKIAFIPCAMGFDLTEGWAATIKSMATSVGMEFTIRDPNWNIDAGAQALTSLISQKPDVIVVHNPDVNSYAKLIQRAEQAGIYIISVNMRSSSESSAFVGVDYTRVGEVQGERIVKFCGKGSGTSGKVAIVQGVITSGASGFNRKGIDNVLSKHPEIKIVADQAADWDATKARNITSTILQANPDICGVIGGWDVMDTGTAAAVQEFNKRAKRAKPVYLITSGGGAKFSCDKVKDGTFSEVVSYNVPGQGRDIFAMISYLLQSKVKPGMYKVSIISPLTLVNKQTIASDSCWDPAELKKK